jgi:hypothetical protein
LICGKYYRQMSGLKTGGTSTRSALPINTATYIQGVKMNTQPVMGALGGVGLGLAAVLGVAALVAPSKSQAATFGVHVSAHAGGSSTPCFSDAATSASCLDSANGSSATASAGLGIGTLEASVNGFGISDAKVTDAITLVLPAGYSASTVSATLNLTASGSVLGNANILDSLIFGSVTQDGCLGSGSQHCTFITHGLSLSITENISISSLTNIFIQANVNPSTSDAGSSASADPPDLSLILPDGVTFTSASGVFLSQSATPLPAALPLFATGLGVMGFLGWRRKRTGARVRA